MDDDRAVMQVLSCILKFVLSENDACLKSSIHACTHIHTHTRGNAQIDSKQQNFWSVSLQF